MPHKQPPAILEPLEPRQLLSVSPSSDPTHPKATLIGGVPLYNWYYGCEPAAVAMTLGYWDSHGYPNIFPGDASSMTAAVQNSIADVAHQTAGKENQPKDWSNHYWGWGDWHNSRSYPQHDKNPNCLADWLMTRDGTSPPGQVPMGTAGYLAAHGYGGWHVQSYLFSQFSFSALAAEINARHPVTAIVDSNADGHADHTVTIVGYDPTTNQYGALNEFDQKVMWYSYKSLAKGLAFGIRSLIVIDPPSRSGPSVEVLGNRWVIDPRPTFQYTNTIDGTDFGQPIGTVRTFTILNGGNQTLSLSSTPITVSGANSAAFTISRKPAVSLAPGASTTFSIKFAAQTAGARWTNITVNSNDLTNPKWTFKIIAGIPANSSFPTPIANRIQAEDFNRGGEGIGYHDTSPDNLGILYRTYEGVDIQDNLSGYTVSYTQPGEWLAYTITSPAAGTYRFDASVASAVQGGKFHLTLDGQAIGGQLTIPNTGDALNYTTISQSNLKLPAGQHTLKIVFDARGAGSDCGDIDWFQLVRTA